MGVKMNNPNIYVPHNNTAEDDFSKKWEVALEKLGVPLTFLMPWKSPKTYVDFEHRPSQADVIIDTSMPDDRRTPTDIFIKQSMVGDIILRKLVEDLLEKLEDQLDIEEAKIVLEEVKEKGTISWEKLLKIQDEGKLF